MTIINGLILKIDTSMYVKFKNLKLKWENMDDLHRFQFKLLRFLSQPRTNR